MAQEKDALVDKMAQHLRQLYPTIKSKQEVSKIMFLKTVFPDEHLSVFSHNMWDSLCDKKSDDTVKLKTLLNDLRSINSAHSDEEKTLVFSKIFSQGKHVMTKEEFLALVTSAYQAYQYAMNGHWPSMQSVEHSEGYYWITAMCSSCFTLQEEMSHVFVSNWLTKTVPKMLRPLHGLVKLQLKYSAEECKVPVIQETPSSSLMSESKEANGNLDSIINWILHCALGEAFTKLLGPDKGEHPLISPSSKMEKGFITEKWELLYHSNMHGQSINRFQYHVYNYKAPTVIFLSTQNGMRFCVAVDVEWVESCHLWGDRSCLLLQLEPDFRVIERGSKIMFSNFSVRGFPFGIAVGKDPKAPCLEIQPDFFHCKFKQIPDTIGTFIVYGCDEKAKTSQQEHKKWEEKEKEKLQSVNRTHANWQDDPDKHILDMATYKYY